MAYEEDSGTRDVRHYRSQLQAVMSQRAAFEYQIFPIEDRKPERTSILRSAVKGIGTFLAGTLQMVQFLRFVCVNLQLRSRHIFLEMFNPGRSRDRKHNWKTCQQPCQGH